MKWGKAAIVAFWSLTTVPVVSAAGPQDAIKEIAIEKNILQALYQATNGESWTRQKGWMSDPVHHCEWEGITCLDPETSSRRRNLQSGEDQRSVEVVDLAENNLKGSAPLSLLLMLPNIRTIRLNGNNVDYSKYADQEQDVLGQTLDLDQPISSNIRHLDVSHTTVSSLESLFHSGHGATQIITPHLTDFHASQASIRGAFPSFIFDVKTLERLSLDHNSLTGHFPATVGNCQKLKYISLASNSLEGPIPEEFNRLNRIRYVLLESNHFTGTIPSGLTSTEYTPLLEQLDLSGQRDITKNPTPSPISGLSGNLPAFNTHKYLRRLDLGANSFGGTVPENFLQATELDYFDFAILSSNDLTGSVPPAVLQRISPDQFSLSDNRITDVIESSCRDMEFGCNTFMCRPGTFEPRAGKQDSDFRPCLSCPQNTLYWGQTKCALSDANPPPPPPPTEAPAPPPGHSGLTEKEILVKLFQATLGASGQWTNSDGWGTDNNICSWYGVKCNDGDSVVGITLNNNNMASATPDSLFDLPNLEYLSFQKNDDLVVTLDGIERARKIETLDLSSTKLGENGLVGLGGASSTLQELYLNDVRGLDAETFPTVLLTLRELKQLTIDYNDIAGSLPNDLGNLNQLVVFSAVSNELTGPIPDSISSLTNLATLRVSTNFMTGTLPPGLQSLSGLTVLDLSNQWSNGEDDDYDTKGNSGFVGTLPSFKGFKELRRFDLGVNSLQGTIPVDFLADVDRSDGGLFEYADISENYLTGTVPAEVASLKHVDLYENRFTGIDRLVCESQPADQLKYGCDGILCKPGFFNEKEGRQTSDSSKCEPCPTGDIDHPYFGATDCDSQDLPFGGPAPTPPADDFNENEVVREALETIYTFCGGASWTMSSGWMDPTRKYCSWDGVRCSIAGDVIGITLRSNGLSGNFPTKTVLEGVPTLQSLDLDGNTVKFDFDGIASAQNLEILDLSHTDLEFIEGIGTAPALKNVYLSSNNLRGPFPMEIFQLNNLSRLSLDFNSLTGTIPGQISSLNNLQFLAIHDNKFSGNIPDEIGELNGLFFLLLQANSLTGPIPNTLESLENLRYLDLSFQTGTGGMGLTGNLPAFATLANLKRFDVNSNNLDGSIPDDFLRDTQVDGFENVDLSKNKLTGKVPAVLKKFQVSQYDVTDNQISGVEAALCDNSLGGAVAAYGCDAVLCPAGKYNKLGRQLDQDDCKNCPENPYFGATSCGNEAISSSSPTATPDPNFDQKTVLSAFYDALNGDGWTGRENWKDASMSPCEWYGITCDDDGNIESIALSGNNMAGVVPKSIFQLPFLRNLILDLNDDLTFSFDGIENARRLHVVDISSTGTKSVRGIEKAKDLKEFHSVANALRGSFPSELFAIDSLERISIGFNEISGELSTEIGQLSNLKLLSCEGNYMSGTLPDTLWSLKKIHTLRLGRNTFTGGIPDSILQLSDLSVLDLSHQTENNGHGLSGPVPAFETMTKITEIDLSSNVLTGEIPPNFLQAANPDVVDYIDLSSNKISGVAPSFLARFDDVKLHDNEITGIDLALCTANRGDTYAKYNCDAVLCPPATYNSRGRQESDTGHCRECPEALFFGSTVCPESIPDPGVSSDREILTYFYRKCGGDDWDNPNGWAEDGISICDWYGIKCVNGEDDRVESIDLGANNVVGIPPQALFFLPHLKHLSLYSNPLDGFSFNGISQAKKLEELILDAAGVTSIMGVGQAPSLKRLNVRFNGIKGTFPSDIQKLSTLEDLMISYNDFTGTLPKYLEDMTNLRSLLMTSNYFSGHLGGVNMPGSMRFLDISDNDLTGSIPESFMTLVPFSAAIEVDFSDNLLTGHIPSDLVRFDHLNLYLANNKITGGDKELCKKQYWNDGDVGKYGCDGLLCPAGTYSVNGRQKDDESPCERCGLQTGDLPYMGMDVCESSKASTRGIALTVSIAASLSVLLLSL